MTTPPSQSAPSAIIMAAGKGTRMKSDLPKVVHPIGGRPMVCAVVDACRAVGCRKIVVIVGYKQELVRDALKGYADLEFAVQEEQLGTGHAVQQARGLYADHLRPGAARHDAFVLCGDGPLIRPATLRTILDTHRRAGAAATLATSIIDDPAGYGRVVRDSAGRFTGIVEQKNATPEQRAIREVNPSYYCLDAAALFSALDRVRRNEVSGEYYITDVFGLLLQDGRRVEVIDAVPPEDVLSINTPEDLATVDRIFRARTPKAQETSR
ncbi:MAG: NTP transferase domain-containing protein [Phycisphaerales bacterium]|nr:NTP transferase domain-containing protein [Phycisphaerales bacterium]